MNPLREAILWASESDTLREQLPRLSFVRRTVDRFMPGEAAEDAIEAASRLGHQGLPTTFTLVGENLDDLAQAAQTTGEYLRLLDRVQELDLDSEVSVKVTQLGYDLDPEVCRGHVERLTIRSAEMDRTLWIDMESSAYVEGTVDLYASVLAEHAEIGLCVQTYLRRTWSDVQRLLPLGPSIRLVKGAYREPHSLAFPDRATVDENYLRLAYQLATGGARRTVLGSHDVGLIRRVEDTLGGDRNAVEIAMLFGIRSDEQLLLSREGYAVRTLISFGPNWYPWFMRRIAEKPFTNSALALRNLL
jgi:proline dehydrogenase